MTKTKYPASVAADAGARERVRNKSHIAIIPDGFRIGKYAIRFDRDRVLAIVGGVLFALFVWFLAVAVMVVL